MSENPDFKTRFYRDGAPYFKDFELVVSQLFGESPSMGNKAVADVTIQLMRGIHDHLASCQSLLGTTEDLVEKARAQNLSEESVEDLVKLCVGLQRLQTDLSEMVTQSVNHFVDEVFPR
jgi:hypothetical protein